MLTAPTAVPLAAIRPGPNHRTVFDPVKLRALADDIAAHGLMFPPVVRPTGGQGFQLVDGERRFRAVTLLGWPTMACNIAQALTDWDARLMMHGGNFTAEKPDPIDEAGSYSGLIRDFGKTEAEVAAATHTRLDHVRERLALVRLPALLQQAVRDKVLPVNYALEMCQSDGLRDKDPELMITLFGKFRDCPSPAIGWFRNLVSELATAASQGGGLFDGEEFFACGPGRDLIAQFEDPDPPLPGRDVPPIAGEDAASLLFNQRTFWLNAAGLWEGRGRASNRKRCEDLAFGLDCALNALPRCQVADLVRLYALSLSRGEYTDPRPMWLSDVRPPHLAAVMVRGLTDHHAARLADDAGGEVVDSTGEDWPVLIPAPQPGEPWRTFAATFGPRLAPA